MKVGYKDVTGKPRTDLLPPKALIEMARVLDFGANRPEYTDNGWREVPDSTRVYVAAALRHILKFMAGQQNDPQSQLHELAHAMTDLAFVVELEGHASDFITFGPGKSKKRSTLKLTPDDAQRLAEQLRKMATEDTVALLNMGQEEIEIKRQD